MALPARVRRRQSVTGEEGEGVTDIQREKEPEGELEGLEEKEELDEVREEEWE